MKGFLMVMIIGLGAFTLVVVDQMHDGQMREVSRDNQAAYNMWLGILTGLMSWGLYLLVLCR